MWKNHSPEVVEQSPGFSTLCWELFPRQDLPCFSLTANGYPRVICVRPSSMDRWFAIVQDIDILVKVPQDQAVQTYTGFSGLCHIHGIHTHTPFYFSWLLSLNYYRSQRIYSDVFSFNIPTNTYIYICTHLLLVNLFDTLKMLFLDNLSFTNLFYFTFLMLVVDFIENLFINIKYLELPFFLTKPKLSQKKVIKIEK